MTTETILTDDQIDHIIEDVAWPNEEVFKFAVEVSRAIEQAVLAKLTEEHTPVAWLNKETGDVISSELKDDAPEMLKGYDVPLYKCPVPNSQVNLDSSNHIADMRKMVVLDGWQLVPIDPTEEMLVSGQEEWVLGKRGAMEDCEESRAIFKAMLAAAPKYKWSKE